MIKTFILIGMSKKGKSTTALGLTGYLLESFVEADTKEIKIQVAVDDPLVTDLIGHKYQSCTLVPNIIYSK